jgi:soluble lytic murein transglycosylase-like protein
MKISLEQIEAQPLNSPSKKINGDSNESLEVKKHRLMKATKEFESFFFLQMLKDMRKTIPKSEMLNGGLGQDIYTSMFDEELARKVSGTSPNSLAQMLFKSLEKHLEAGQAAHPTNEAQKAEVSTSVKDISRMEINKYSMPRVKADSKPAENFKEQTKVQEPAAKPPEPIGDVSYPRPRIIDDPVLKEFGATIEEASRQFNVDPRLIYSVILAESGGQPDAVSPKGAKGLMQLIDSTATEMGVSDSLDPHQNIIGGTRYLRQLLDKYSGNIKLTLAAYNAGPGTVSKYNGVPPYSETRQYIENVLAQLHNAKKP